jgi:multidrug efflux pump subunit AcrA (membrane-fusion protein)
VGWEKGRYYTRSKKVNGRVVREYVGFGRVAELAAELDAIERQQRQAERAALLAKRAELDALDAPLDDLNDLAELLARAALMAAGFCQHKRGEWRKRRVQRDENC